MAVGSGVRSLKAGDAVYGLHFKTPMDMTRMPGFVSEYAVSQERFLSAKPAHVSFEDAAALAASVLTAYQSIERALQLMGGDGDGCDNSNKDKTATPAASLLRGQDGVSCRGGPQRHGLGRRAAAQERLRRRHGGLDRIDGQDAAGGASPARRRCRPPGRLPDAGRGRRRRPRHRRLRLQHAVGDAVHLPAAAPQHRRRRVHRQRATAGHHGAQLRPRRPAGLDPLADAPWPAALRLEAEGAPGVRLDFVSGNPSARADLDRAGEIIASGAVRAVTTTVDLDNIDAVRRECAKVYKGKGGLGALVIQIYKE